MSDGRRNGRTDRKRRRSFNIPMVRAKFILTASAPRRAHAGGELEKNLLPINRSAKRTTSRILRAGKFYNGVLASKDQFLAETKNRVRNFSAESAREHLMRRRRWRMLEARQVAGAGSRPTDARCSLSASQRVVMAHSPDAAMCSMRSMCSADARRGSPTLSPVSRPLPPLQQ